MSTISSACWFLFRLHTWDIRGKNMEIPWVPLPARPCPSLSVPARPRPPKKQISGARSHRHRLDTHTHTHPHLAGSANAVIPRKYTQINRIGRNYQTPAARFDRIAGNRGPGTEQEQTKRPDLSTWFQMNVVTCSFLHTMALRLPLKSWRAHVNNWVSCQKRVHNNAVDIKT